MSKYIWFSGATDITGKALAEALDLSGSKTKPRNLRANDILIGWGTKTDEDISINNNVHILNHPNKIRSNRNKLASLEIMKADNDLSNAIAPFCTADRVMASLHDNTVTLPLVGRTKYHQGGKGFWLCLTKALVENAIAGGAQYFQNFIDIRDEYRLHVAFGNVIYAVKKIQNDNETSWTAQRKEKIQDYAQKNDVNIDEPTMDYVLKRMYKEAVLPDMIVRSNRRGWKFSSVRLNNVSASLKTAAINAVSALGLDFGAVDCAMCNDNNPYIIEINSGPGLQGTALTKYVEAFTAKIEELENAHEEPAATPRRARAKGANQNNNVMAAGVGAENAPSSGLVTLMNNVKTDEEAQAVIAALLAQHQQKQG